MVNAQDRYTIEIVFQQNNERVTEDIITSEKTLRDANSWQQLVDTTVKKASLTDNTNGKVIYWKQ